MSRVTCIAWVVLLSCSGATVVLGSDKLSGGALKTTGAGGGLGSDFEACLGGAGGGGGHGVDGCGEAPTAACQAPVEGAVSPLQTTDAGSVLHWPFVTTAER